MTKFRTLLVVIAAAAVAALGASSALAGGAKIIAFKASFAGTATSKATDTRVDIAARGTGTGTPIGKSTLSGAGVGTSEAGASCVPFSGPGTIVTSARLKLKFVVQPSSTGCAGEDQNQVTVTGAAKFAGGTGKFKTARGSFTFTGYYDRGTGAFSVKFSGSLRI